MTNTPKPYHHGNLRRSLLRAAAVSLEAVGPRDLSLRELSRELGVSHTAPRRHFADKQQLLDALAQDGYEQVRIALAEAAANPPADFTERLTRLALAYVDFVQRHPALMELMLTTKHSGNAPHLVEASGLAFAPVLAAIRDGQASGEVVAEDPDGVKVLIFATLLGLAAMSSNGLILGEPLSVSVTRSVRQIVEGLRPRPEPHSQARERTSPGSHASIT
ncbi:MAG: TetR/AcrR family transcriptional regulator [Candidatus Methylacidiphilales bacterium]